MTRFHHVGKNVRFSLDGDPASNKHVTDDELSALEVMIGNISCDSFLDFSYATQAFTKVFSNLRLNPQQTVVAEPFSKLKSEELPTVSESPAKYEDEEVPILENFTGRSESWTYEEEASHYSLRTEDEIREVVDVVAEFFGLSDGKEHNTRATRRTKHRTNPLDSLFPCDPTRENRDVRNSTRTATLDRSLREGPDGPSTPQPGKSDVVELVKHESMSYSFDEMSITESHSTLAFNESLVCFPRVLEGGATGKKDHDGVQTVMEFLAYPEKYLQRNKPKGNHRAYSSLKDSRPDSVVMIPAVVETSERKCKIVGERINPPVVSEHRQDDEKQPVQSWQVSKRDQQVNDELTSPILDSSPQSNCVPNAPADSQGFHDTSAGKASENISESSPKERDIGRMGVLAHHSDHDGDVLGARNNTTANDDTRQDDDWDLNVDPYKLRREGSVISESSSTKSGSRMSPIVTYRSPYSLHKKSTISVPVVPGKKDRNSKKKRNIMQRFSWMKRNNVR